MCSGPAEGALPAALTLDHCPPAPRRQTPAKLIHWAFALPSSVSPPPSLLCSFSTIFLLFFLLHSSLSFSLFLSVPAPHILLIFGLSPSLLVPCPWVPSWVSLSSPLNPTCPAQRSLGLLLGPSSEHPYLKSRDRGLCARQSRGWSPASSEVSLQEQSLTCAESAVVVKGKLN